MNRLTITLVERRPTFDDYDIGNHPSQIKRACVPLGIKNGDRFNVYYGSTRKSGITWRGTLEKSLLKSGLPIHSIKAAQV